MQIYFIQKYMNDYARACLKSVVRTKFDIYVFISITGSILLLVNYLVLGDIIRPVVVLRHWHGLFDKSITEIYGS
jgi:hypothetical protein